MVTEVFGVKGVMGDLVIAPAFMPEQFDAQDVYKRQVQMNRREEFDRLWKWTRTYMYIEDGPCKNYL